MFEVPTLYPKAVNVLNAFWSRPLLIVIINGIEADYGITHPIKIKTNSRVTLPIITLPY